MLPWDVLLLPCKQRVSVVAGDVIDAAEKARTMVDGLVNEAIPMRADNPYGAIEVAVPFTDTPKAAVHYVGFRDPAMLDRAIRLWGGPVIIHKLWDVRAVSEIVDGDLTVFAKYLPDDVPSEMAWDASQEF